MCKAVVTVAFLISMSLSAAYAQSGKAGSSNTAAAQGSQGGMTAPVGHRQPRTSDVPSEKNLSDPNDPLSKENALLDKKIKSICRGC